MIGKTTKDGNSVSDFIQRQSKPSLQKEEGQYSSLNGNMKFDFKDLMIQKDNNIILQMKHFIYWICEK